jgi:hypothetical protein
MLEVQLGSLANGAEHELRWALASSRLHVDEEAQARGRREGVGVGVGVGVMEGADMECLHCWSCHPSIAPKLSRLTYANSIYPHRRRNVGTEPFHMIPANI